MPGISRENTPSITSNGTDVTHLPIEEKKEKCKPCCACPETKRARDACIVENGEENCRDLIDAHRECMLKMGFKI